MVGLLRSVFVLVALSVLIGASDAAGASGEADCRKQVIADWSSDGRVDRIYPLDCYQRAIEAMPPDIRDYTDAHDEIERALSLAIRAKGPGDGGGSTAATPERTLATTEPATGETAFPASLLVLFGLTAVILVGGAVTWLGRLATRGPRGRHG